MRQLKVAKLQKLQKLQKLPLPDFLLDSQQLMRYFDTAAVELRSRASRTHRDSLDDGCGNL